MSYDYPKVPETCPACRCRWSGGHEIPNGRMQEGLRVFYDCGASLSCKHLGDGAFQFLFKNCNCSPEIEENHEPKPTPSSASPGVREALEVGGKDCPDCSSKISHEVSPEFKEAMKKHLAKDKARAEECERRFAIERTMESIVEFARAAYKKRHEFDALLWQNLDDALSKLEALRAEGQGGRK